MALATPGIHHVTAIAGDPQANADFYVGVLFEMATPEPGFMVDEDLDELGSALALPEWLEDERERIEIELLPFDGPSSPEQD